ncbi:hypothetical protein [Kitasatospora mediocidica]|uniref:hypothetical protein n=1 Tax=Kitasatospora mediocidica TaxID=58352 RepID=UPI0012F8C479|nr:hypothetical protein [Kitasatospora mediocidica]
MVTRSARTETSRGRALLVCATVLALLMVAAWWFLGDHKPGIAPEKARQELDAAADGTFGSLSPAIKPAFFGYGSEPDYSNFHITYKRTGRATFTREQGVLTPIAQGKLEGFRGMVKDYWAKSGYAPVHEKFLDAPAGRTREWTTTAPGGVSVRLDMDEFSPFQIKMLVAVGEVNYSGSGDPFEPLTSSGPPALAGPEPSWYQGPWPNPANADPYWSH